MDGRGDGSKISFLQVEDRDVAAFPTRDFTRKATWYRLFLPELLPEVDRLLYLDVDALVRDDLTRLWETNLAGNYLGAVTNVFQADHLHRTEKIGIRPRDYFNAGVLLMDLDLMRREACTKALSEFAAAHPELIGWRDQDTLNAVLGKRRLHLHPRWNCMHSIMRFSASVEVFGPEAVEEAQAQPGDPSLRGPGREQAMAQECRSRRPSAVPEGAPTDPLASTEAVRLALTARP